MPFSQVHINKEIPHKIHYCWFGKKPLPKSAVACLESWRRFFPEYEIKRWDESNYDVDSIPYTKEAYAKKMYAFVSDYARFDILHNEGGIYFDTDVEVIRPMDDIVSAGPFLACESTKSEAQSFVATGLGMGALKGMELIADIMKDYHSRTFSYRGDESEPQTVTRIVTNILQNHGFSGHVNEKLNIAGFTVYPEDYFCPVSTVDGRIRVTSNTRSIHYYEQSWQSPLRKYGRSILLRLGGRKFMEMMKSIILKKNT